MSFLENLGINWFDENGPQASSRGIYVDTGSPIQAVYDPANRWIALSLSAGNLIESAQNRIVGRIEEGEGGVTNLTPQQTADVLGSGPLDLYANGRLRVGQSASTTELVFGHTGANCDVDASVLALRGVLGIDLETSDLEVNAEDSLTVTSPLIDYTIGALADTHKYFRIWKGGDAPRFEVMDHIRIVPKDDESLYVGAQLDERSLRIRPADIRFARGTISDLSVNVTVGDAPEDTESRAVWVRGGRGAGNVKGGDTWISGGFPDVPATYTNGHIDVLLGQEIASESAGMRFFTGPIGNPKTAQLGRISSVAGQFRITTVNPITFVAAGGTSLAMNSLIQLVGPLAINVMTSALSHQNTGGVEHAGSFIANAVTTADTTGPTVVATLAIPVNFAGVVKFCVTGYLGTDRANSVSVIIRAHIRRGTDEGTSGVSERHKAGSGSMASVTFDLDFSTPNLRVRASGMPAGTKTFRGIMHIESRA